MKIFHKILLLFIILSGCGVGGKSVGDIWIEELTPTLFNKYEFQLNGNILLPNNDNNHVYYTCCCPENINDSNIKSHLLIKDKSTGEFIFNTNIKIKDYTYIYLDSIRIGFIVRAKESTAYSQVLKIAVDIDKEYFVKEKNNIWDLLLRITFFGTFGYAFVLMAFLSYNRRKEEIRKEKKMKREEIKKRIYNEFGKFDL